MFQRIFAVTFCFLTAISLLAAQSQKSDGDQDKNFDVRSSAGDLHLGKDADAQKVGLPLYPGARVRHDEHDSNAFNLGAFTEAFGIKLVIAKYESDDAPGKVIDYYREQLKKYGKVLECHTKEHGSDSHADVNDDENSKSKELKCEGDNSGPVTELKVGTEDNQRIVAIEPNQGHSGSIFAMVFVRTRGNAARSKVVGIKIVGDLRMLEI